MADSSKPCDAAIAEGVATTPTVGRPRNKPPVGSVLNVIKGIEETLVETGELDYSLTHAQLAAYVAINLERGFLAPEKVVPLKTKVDWCLRVTPTLNMLKDMIPKDGGKYPHTEDAIVAETQKSAANIARIKANISKTPAQAIEHVISVLEPKDAN